MDQLPATSRHRFDGERTYLLGIAYRMLGSRSDAEDIVQEALLRGVHHKEELRTPRAFLTTVVTRLCLDELGSARRRRESYVGPYLPEPVLTDRLDASEHPAEYRENVSTALLLVLDQLTAPERAVFVLRDVFDLDYGAIARALERSEASCRKLRQRARVQLLEARLQPPAAATHQEAVSTAFFRALASGDLQGLTEVLAEDASIHTDHGGKATAARRVITGSTKVARFLQGLWKKRNQQPSAVRALLRYVNGAPGLVLMLDDVVIGTLTLRIAYCASEARIVEISMIRNPDKLRRLQTALMQDDVLEVAPHSTP